MDPTKTPYKPFVGASLTGFVAHSLLCPFDGLVALLLKTGFISIGSLGSLSYTHDFLEGRLVRPALETFIKDPQKVELLSEEVLHYGGLSLGFGMPIAYLGYNRYRRKKEDERR